MRDQQFSFEGFQAAKALLSHFRTKTTTWGQDTAQNLGAAMESVRTQPGFAEVAGMLATVADNSRSVRSSQIEPATGAMVMTAAVYAVQTKVAVTEIAARSFVTRYAHPDCEMPPLDRLKVTLDTSPGAREHLAAIITPALATHSTGDSPVGMRAQGVIDKLNIVANLRPA
jgi:hypothetical protein